MSVLDNGLPRLNELLQDLGVEAAVKYAPNAYTTWALDSPYGSYLADSMTGMVCHINWKYATHVSERDKDMLLDMAYEIDGEE